MCILPSKDKKKVMVCRILIIVKIQMLKHQRPIRYNFGSYLNNKWKTETRSSRASKNTIKLEKIPKTSQILEIAELPKNP